MEPTSENLVNITTFGVHTCRYNSLVSLPESDRVIYTKGNEVVLKCMSTFEVIDSFKIMDDAILVVR